MLKNKLYRVIILPDLHVPFTDMRSLRAIEEFEKDYRFDEWVQLGDLMDFDMISRFNKDALRKLETRRILADYAAAGIILDRQQAIIRANNKKAKFTLLEGNHDYRIEMLIDREPQLEGLLELEKNLKLEKRQMQFVRSWSKGEEYKIGKLHLMHGVYTNKYHAAKIADNYGCNMVYGHTHDVQSYAKQIRGKDKVIKAQSLGHLSDESKVEWLRRMPTNWCQAFGIAEIRQDGSYNLHVIEIINHQFSYNGKLYKG